jgi:predicted sugar kinase
MASFESGYMTNPLPEQYTDLQLDPAYETVSVQYPSRLEAMALDPSQIALRADMKYPAGQVDICVDATRTIEVTAVERDGITITGDSQKMSLIRHAALLMKQALGYQGGFDITVPSDTIPRHCGFGSSSSMIAAVSAAINELFNRPISPLDLARYCAQNHGEEIDSRPDQLTPVQCIGGSAITGMFEGSLFIIAGESTPIYKGELPIDSRVVVGVPKDYDHPDAQQLLDDEIDGMEGFVATGERYGQKIAYNLVHEVLPGLVENDLRPLKKLIFDYRWRMGSIDNCAFVFPGIVDIAQELAHHETKTTTDLVALSSVGPGFFAVTSTPDEVAIEFEALEMKTTIFQSWNKTYQVERK